MDINIPYSYKELDVDKWTIPCDSVGIGDDWHIIAVTQYEYSIGMNRFVPSSCETYILNGETSIDKRVADIMACKEGKI